MPKESILSCFNHIAAYTNGTKSVRNDDFIYGKTKSVYITRSPCHDIMSYPICQNYCKWYARVNKTLWFWGSGS